MLEGYVFPSHFSCPDEDPEQESRENLGRESKWKKELDFMGCDGVCIGIEKKRNEQYFVCVCLDAFNFNVIIPLLFLLSLEKNQIRNALFFLLRPFQSGL